MVNPPSIPVWTDEDSSSDGLPLTTFLSILFKGLAPRSASVRAPGCCVGETSWFTTFFEAERIVGYTMILDVDDTTESATMR